MSAARGRPILAALAFTFFLAAARPARAPGHHTASTHPNGDVMRTKTGNACMHATKARCCHMAETPPAQNPPDHGLAPGCPKRPARLPCRWPHRKKPDSNPRPANACCLLKHAAPKAELPHTLPPQCVKIPPSCVKVSWRSKKPKRPHCATTSASKEHPKRTHCATLGHHWTTIVLNACGTETDRRRH